MWASPEILAGSAVSAAADVFSFGVVLWELATGRLPWFSSRRRRHISWGSITRRVRAGRRLRCRGGLFHESPALRDVVKQCWAENPGERPEMDAVGAVLRAELERRRAEVAAGFVAAGATATATEAESSSSSSEDQGANTPLLGDDITAPRAVVAPSPDTFAPRPVAAEEEPQQRRRLLKWRCVICMADNEDNENDCTVCSEMRSGFERMIVYGDR